MANNSKNQRGRGRGNEPKDEFGQATIDLARVTRVMAGGKRMRFRACVAVGDRKGRLGLGLAKGADVALAMTKANNDARKRIVKINITEEGSIPHQVLIKWKSSKLLIKPAPVGTGIRAGSVLRPIFELAGVRNVVAKVLGSGNRINNARAVIAALTSTRAPKPRPAAKIKPA